MEVYQGKFDFIAVCFDKKDRDAAEILIDDLQNNHLRTWSSERGCDLTQAEDADRFAACRTVIILISKDMLASDDCAALIRAAVEQDKALVLLLIDHANLVGRDDLNAMLNRSVRMIDYAPESVDDCINELTGLDCVYDCLMLANETPDMKKTSIWDILNCEL